MPQSHLPDLLGMHPVGGDDGADDGGSVLPSAVTVFHSPIFVRDLVSSSDALTSKRVAVHASWCLQLPSTSQLIIISWTGKRVHFVDHSTSVIATEAGIHLGHLLLRRIDIEKKKTNVDCIVHDWLFFVSFLQPSGKCWPSETDAEAISNLRQYPTHSMGCWFCFLSLEWARLLRLVLVTVISKWVLSHPSSQFRVFKVWLTKNHHCYRYSVFC